MIPWPKARRAQEHSYPEETFFGFESFFFLGPIKMQKSRQAILAQVTDQIIDVQCPAAID